MKKVVRNIVICLYFIVTVLITYCLLSYNKYNVTEFKDKTILVYENKENNYKKSDLLVIHKSKRYKKGDVIFYYDTYDNPVSIKINKILSASGVNETVNAYTLEDDRVFNDDNIIGTVSNVDSYMLLGSIYSLLVSKWGYLIIIIFPILVAFIYEIYQIIREIKKR